MVMLRESVLETTVDIQPIGDLDMRRRGFLKGLGAAGSTLAGARLFGPPLAQAGSGGGSAGGLARLRRWPATLQARWARFDAGQLVNATSAALDPRAAARAELDGATWTATLRAIPVKGQPDATDLLATFKLVKGSATGANVGVSIELGDWSRDDYLLLPGAVYNGNRFESRHSVYPPLLNEPADIGPNVPAIISDVPRLNIHPGPSRIDLLAGDLTTPAIAVWSRRLGAALIVLTDQTTPWGDVGIGVQEDLRENGGGAGTPGSDDGTGGAPAHPSEHPPARDHASLLITAPGVRQEHRYALGNTRAPSHDEGATFTRGSEITLRLRLYAFACPELQGLFDRFIVVRKDLSGHAPLRHTLPFSSAARLQEEKYNRENWADKPGYYATSVGDGAAPSWQTGWGGGLIATHPLLFGGDALTRERVFRTFDLVFDKGQARSGFFHAASDGRGWLDEGAAAAARGGGGGVAASYKQARSWHLVRRSGDVLYFMLKQLALLERQDPAFKPNDGWSSGLLACADAFVLLWDRHHQLGQFVNVDSGLLVVGGSTAGAIVPAGLALAARRFKSDEHLRVAIAAAELFHQRFVRAGLTCGGPADALQCPDSESAAALLESFVVLFEISGDAIWIERAADVAHQLATWQMSYDFRFPARSTFARLDIQTTGAVVGNVQNKQAGPGFALHSGDALFRLYRATGKILYLELLRDTAHNLTQYLNRADHLLHPRSEPGWTCGRVTTSDASDPVGETAAPPSPSEICGLLTAIEVPGLYVQPDSGLVFAFDHVVARIKEKTPSRLVVSVFNPTAFEAAVRVLAETDAERAQPLGPNALWGGRVVTVAPGASEDLELARGPA
jgi:hypothetical protein